MANLLTLGEARFGLIQGILLSSEQLHATDARRIPYQYSYAQQQAGLAAQAATWLSRIGSGSYAEDIQGFIKSGDLHPAIAGGLRDFAFSAAPQSLRPSLTASGLGLQLGPDAQISFFRRPRLSPTTSPAPLPLFITQGGRLLVPAWPDESIGVSVNSGQAPWGLQLFFDEINAFSGESGKGYDPLRQSFYPDHAVVKPGTPFQVEGWRDRSIPEDPKHPGHYAANRFVPTMLQDPLCGIMQLKLFGLDPDLLVEVSQNAISELIGQMTSSRPQLDLESYGRQETLEPPSSDRPRSSDAASKTPRMVEEELKKILRSDASLVEMLRRHDPRSIPTLQGAGRVWQAEPGQDPYFDHGWKAAFGMTVFVVHPSAFYEWTGIRHEPQRSWPEAIRYPERMSGLRHQLGGSMTAELSMLIGLSTYLGLGQEDGIYDIGACATGFASLAAMTPTTADPSIVRAAALTGPRAIRPLRRQGFVAGVGSLSPDTGRQGSGGQNAQNNFVPFDPQDGAPDKK